VKRHFHCETRDEPVVTPENKFEIEFSSKLLGTVLMSIKERYEQLHQQAETWCFVCKFSELTIKENLIKLFKSSAGFDRWF
jgi:hypothetical protein